MLTLKSNTKTILLKLNIAFRICLSVFKKKECIEETKDLSLNKKGKSIHSIPLLKYEI